jgi:hypothetical protein
MVYANSEADYDTQYNKLNANAKAYVDRFSKEETTPLFLYLIKGVSTQDNTASTVTSRDLHSDLT